jgi:sugar/nucleoside kinase (ribokinase family)
MAMAAGCRGLCVTLGPRGVAYFEPLGGATRTERLVATLDAPGRVTGGDPTGCGDLFGAAAAAALLAGDALPAALRRALQLAARNVTHRGATGLRDHLLGRLSPA